jgi:hypothetical protein
MFFVLLCILMASLLLTHHAPDQYGWMMLLGLGWLTGYLDCRRFSRSDQDKDRVLPPDMIDGPLDDSNLFQP